MYSRAIFDHATNLNIFIDSDSFDTPQANNEKIAEKLLLFGKNKQLRYNRTEKKTSNPHLISIPEMNKWMSETIRGLCNQFQNNDNTTKELYFPDRVINEYAEEIFDDYEHSAQTVAKILPIMAYKWFNNKESCSIYITDDEKLLSYRNRLLNQKNSNSICIFSLIESSLVLDLFFKASGLYYSKNSRELTIGYWYHLSTYEKLPHIFGFNDPIMSGLFNRMSFALHCLDEIGIQNFKDVTPNNQYITSYNFTYLISLITGIFDNLAIITDSLLHFEIKTHEEKTLSKNRKVFRNCVKETYPELFDFIHNSDLFISLIHEFREITIHREGFDPLTFRKGDKNNGFLTCFVRLPLNMNKAIDLIKKNEGDPQVRYPASSWGLYECNEEFFLNPYNFSLMAMLTLVKFTDRYLELLKMKSEFADREIKRDDPDFDLFAKYHLGF
jgi:hypothetical protein